MSMYWTHEMEDSSIEHKSDTCKGSQVRRRSQVRAASTSLRNRLHTGTTFGIDSNNIYLLYLRSTKAGLQTKAAGSQSLKR